MDKGRITYSDSYGDISGFQMRPYDPKDRDAIISLLKGEGWSGENEDLESNPTFIMEREGKMVGFFTYRVEKHGYPHLLHFFVDKPYRGGYWALVMLRRFKEMLRKEGHERYIMHGVKSRNHLDRIVSWVAHKAPYGETTAHRFYLLEA